MSPQEYREIERLKHQARFSEIMFWLMSIVAGSAIFMLIFAT